MQTLCYCNSNKEFVQCCKPIIQGNKKALTAEQLMRSRYSAYATSESQYLLNTTHPSQQKNHKETDIKAWAIANKWQKLEIISKVQGQQEDNRGKVEFKAYYLDSNGIVQVHHEKSLFIKELQQWYYFSGVINPKTSNNEPNRNDPCPCGTGKKYKKCCGR